MAAFRMWSKQCQPSDRRHPVPSRSIRWAARCSSCVHLAIQEGGTASLEFRRVHFTDVPDAERQRIRQELEDYCGQDPEGTIWIIDTLRKNPGRSEFQGQAPTPLAMQQYMLLQRNLVYTGITRGKKLVVLIGQRKALAMAVKNNRTENRFSGLLTRLTEQPKLVAAQD